MGLSLGRRRVGACTRWPSFVSHCKNAACRTLRQIWSDISSPRIVIKGFTKWSELAQKPVQEPCARSGLTSRLRRLLSRDLRSGGCSLSACRCSNFHPCSEHMKQRCMSCATVVVSSTGALRLMYSIHCPVHSTTPTETPLLVALQARDTLRCRPRFFVFN